MFWKANLLVNKLNNGSIWSYLEGGSMAEWLELLTRNLEMQGSGLLSDHWLGLFARVVM